MLIKVKQLNDNFFLNTCEVKNKQKIALMSESECCEDELIRNEIEMNLMKRPSRVNTRDIRAGE